VDKANREVAKPWKEYAKAATVQRLLKLFPDSALCYNMAVAQAGLMNEEKVTAEIDTAIRLEPAQVPGQKDLALLRELGQKP
jgi:hypothetical protein